MRNTRFEARFTQDTSGANHFHQVTEGFQIRGCTYQNTVAICFSAGKSLGQSALRRTEESVSCGINNLWLLPNMQIDTLF